MPIDEPWVAHGICTNRSCAYSGDMKWYLWGDDTAVCPECGWEIPWVEMPDTTEERDKKWKDENDNR